MDFVVACTSGAEIGFLTGFESIDIDIGDTNDFEVVFPDTVYKTLDYRKGYLFFAPGTELGGIFERLDTSTKSGTCTYKGWTWRGLLAQKVIEPPSGSAYRTVSGDANAIIAALIGTNLGPLVTASTAVSGFTISNYAFDRYCTLLDGFAKMLRSVGARLKIEAKEGAAGSAIGIVVSAVPIVDYSAEIELSQDNKLDFSTQDSHMGTTHLICLGKGELTERAVVHLYVQADGSIGTTQHYTGLADRVAIYDYSSADNSAVLLQKGAEKLTSLCSYKKMSMVINSIDAEIGDIVGGRDRITGMSMAQPITGKIIKVDDTGAVDIQYKLEGSI